MHSNRTVATRNTAMHVSLHSEPLNGPRTGIGHYLTELTRCLTGLFGPDDRLDHFPPELVTAAREATVPPGYFPPPPSPRSLFHAFGRYAVRRPARILMAN